MAMKKSPWIIHYDGSSCNGCDIEVLACLTPVYDLERFGIINTGNPKHADIFLITGSINEQNREVVQNIYNQMPNPKVVVALGICATSGGVFAECYNVLGGVDKVLPVDVYVPGCAVRPESIIDGVVKSLDVLEKKSQKIKSIQKGLEHLTITNAVEADALEILNLQKTAYQSEGEIYNDFSLSPLTQTIEQIQDDLKNMVFFKAVIDSQIIGSVRGLLDEGVCRISRLIVHPLYQDLGIGTKLLRHLEQHFQGAKRFELFTGHKSQRNIYFYQRLGYKICRREKVSERRERVYFEKLNGQAAI